MRASYLHQQGLSVVEKNDVPRLQAVAVSLIKTITPDVVFVPQPGDIPLDIYIQNHASPYLLSELITKGLPEVIAIAFVLGESVFEPSKIFVSSDQGEIKKIYFHPVNCLCGLSKLFEDVLNKREITFFVHSRFTVKNLKYYPELIDGQFTQWFLSETKSSSCNANGFAITAEKLSNNQIFMQKSYAVFLRWLLMPQKLVADESFKVLPDIKEQAIVDWQKAIFISDGIAVENQKFLEVLSQHEKFVNWYFFPGRAEIKLAVDFSVEEELLNYRQQKILFMMAKSKIGMTFDVLLGIEKKCLSQKYDSLPTGAGPDLHALLIAFRAYFERMHFLSLEAAPLLDWEERNIFLNKKLEFLIDFIEKNALENIESQFKHVVSVFKAVKRLLPCSQEPRSLSETVGYVVEDLGRMSADQIQKRFFLWALTFSSGDAELANAEIMGALATYFYEVKEKSGLFSSGIFGRFSKTVTSGVTPENLQRFQVEIAQVVHHEKLMDVFGILFIEQGQSIDLVHQRFMEALLEQYQREYCAKELLFKEKTTGQKKWSEYQYLSQAMISRVANSLIQHVRLAVAKKAEQAMVIM